MAIGYDPLRDDEPELARTMAASVTQRIDCGEGRLRALRRRSRAKSGPDRTFDGLARDLVMKGNVPHSQVLAAPVSTGFPYTPTPRCQLIGVTSWNT